VPEWESRKAIRQADVLGLPLGEDVRHDRTRSDLERDFLRICKTRRLPYPEINVRVGSYLVDFLWRERRLAVETDGYGYHRGRQAFRDDRRRDLDLRGRGFEVVRLSEEQVAGEPDRVAEVLRELLASTRHRVGGDGRSEE
jgi:very-short-patch-repair endonuclease